MVGTEAETDGYRLAVQKKELKPSRLLLDALEDDLNTPEAITALRAGYKLARDGGDREKSQFLMDCQFLGLLRHNKLWVHMRGVSARGARGYPMQSESGGDTSVDLESTLLAGSLSGRGLDLELARGQDAYHLFYSDAQGSFGGRSYGLELVHPLSPTARLALTALRFDQPEQQLLPLRFNQSGSALGVYGSYDPARRWSFSGEAACFAGEISSWDQAYRLTTRYTDKQLAAGAEYIYSGREFFGAWRDLERYRVDLAYNVSKGVRLFSSQTSDQRNVRHEPSEPETTQDGLTLGATVDIGKDTTVRITRRAEGRSAIGAENEDERSITMEYELRQRWRKSAAGVKLESERNCDRVAQAATSQERLQCLWSYDFSRKTSLSLDYSIDDLRPEPDEPRASQLSGNFSFVPDKKSKASLLVRQGFGDNASTWLGGEYNRQLAGARELAVRVQANAGYFGNEFALSMQYTLPLGLHLRQFPVYGVIQGRVFSAHDSTRGLAGVLVKSTERRSLQVRTEASACLACCRASTC